MHRLRSHRGCRLRAVSWVFVSGANFALSLLTQVRMRTAAHKIVWPHIIGHPLRCICCCCSTGLPFHLHADKCSPGWEVRKWQGACICTAWVCWCLRPTPSSFSGNLRVLEGVPCSPSLVLLAFGTVPCLYFLVSLILQPLLKSELVQV